jgi:ATP-dependent helicase/nuclease subunit A
MTISLVDADARERIRSALDESLLVEAGAGTGKTTVLVARLVEILRTGYATVDELVVITFTEKAATELAARVRERREEASATTADEDERDRLHTALRALYRARIETIHAFAASLLRERPVESPVDPGLRVLDEVASSVLFADVYDAWLDEMLQTHSQALARAVQRGFDTTHLHQLAVVLHAQRAALPAVLAPVDRPDREAFRSAINAATEILRDRLAACTKPDADLAFAQAERLIDWVEVALTQDPSELERRVLFRAPAVKGRCGAKGNWASAEDLAAVRTAAESIGEQVGLYAGALRDEVIADVVPLVEEFVRRYEARRRADGVADFDDLLVWARDLLRNPEVRTYFHRTYRCVLVDEFQDTDPVQAELALLLTDVDGDDLPEPGRLVVVGDPKQSIYRFRRADIAIYDQVKFGPLQGGQAIIQQNFRSTGGVLDWVNRVFADAFADGEVGVQPPHVPLLAVRDAPDPNRASVMVVHGHGEAASADEIRCQEAERLAAVLDQAVRNECWTIEDPDSGAVRPAMWRDCVILLPARTGIDRYVDALTNRDIPHRAETRGEFFGTPEVAELTGLLRAVDDPTDTPSIVATLRSRAFGCSDDELLEYSVAARGRIDYRMQDADEPTPVVEALSILRDLHRQRRGLSLAELVRRATEEAGFVELALARGGGAQAAANILKVADLARAFTVSGGGGLRAFTRWLDQQEDEEIGEAEASVSEESDDLVRLMTIHAAKGLEFPIVLLANMSADVQRPQGPFGDPVERRIGFRVGTGKTGHFMTADFDEWADREKVQLTAEKLRLLYVALTRARDHLVIPVVAPPGKRKGLLGVLERHLPELDDETRGRDVDGVHVLDPELLPVRSDVVAVPAEVPTHEEVDAAIAGMDAWSAARRATVNAAGEGLHVITASSVRPLDRVSPLAAVADAGDAAIALDLAPPVDIGTAVHRVLEHVALPPGDELEALTGAVCAEAGITPALPEVLELVRRCLVSPSVLRALAAERFEREVPFSAVLDDGVHLVGRMDLVFRDGDELVIVDFKTDEVVIAGDMDAATVKHSGQAAAYAIATERGTGLPVREVVFVYPRANGERVLPRAALSASVRPLP